MTKDEKIAELKKIIQQQAAVIEALTQKLAEQEHIIEELREKLVTIQSTPEYDKIKLKKCKCADNIQFYTFDFA